MVTKGNMRCVPICQCALPRPSLYLYFKHNDFEDRSCDENIFRLHITITLLTYPYVPDIFADLDNAFTLSSPFDLLFCFCSFIFINVLYI